MKLLKKMSTFVVALTFLFVFSIKANAAETYKVGDKVLFGDFGGHVIEDSDSNSNTVKVYVDGWNKTQEEWRTYWTSKFVDANGQITFSNFDITEYIKNSIKNENNFSSSYASFDDLKSIINVEEYTAIFPGSGQVGKDLDNDGNYHFHTYYTKSSIPEWLLAENYNLYGVYSKNRLDLIYYNFIDDSDLKSEQFTNISCGAGFLLSSKQYGDGIATYDIDDVNDVFYDFDGRERYEVYENYGGGLHKLLDEIDGIKYIISFSRNTLHKLQPSNEQSFVNIGYLMVTLDKSNLKTDKCDDYSDSYKITYETNGGDKIDAVSVTGNKELTTPKREGYIFDGWYTDSNFTTKVSSITPTLKKTDTCIQGFNDVTVYAKWKKELTSDKVSIVGEEKSLENVSSIAVKLLDKVTANIVGTLKTFTAYDITLKDVDGKSVEPSGKVKLSLEIPKDYDKNNIGVYREDGEKLIAYETTINGEYAEIETDHFSTYIVGEKAEAKQEEQTTTKVTDETSSKDNTNSKDNATNDSNIQNPKTGDNMIIFFVIGLLLVGGIAIVGKRLKKVK